MKPLVIELESVTVDKTSHRPLEDVCLQIAQNEFVGILGPNGAGKTSLLNVIAGFEPFRGALRLFGKPESGRRSRAARVRIGYVPQSFDIDPAFPIRTLEAVMLGACGRRGLFRAPGREDRERALELLEIMRIAPLANRPLGHLSGGERQKVSIARAIMQRPDVLLLDEPNANLDIAVQKEVLNLIEEIYARESPAVLFVTHDFNMLPAAMHRAVFLNRGRIVFDGPTHEAMTGDRMSRLFAYPLEFFERSGRRFVSFG